VSLYVRLFVFTGLPFGVVMALVQGETSSVGDFVRALAIIGIPFGALMALILGTLDRRGEHRELEKRAQARGER